MGRDGVGSGNVCKVLQRTTKYYNILQRTTPILFPTTKYYYALQNAAKYYSVLRTTKYHYVLQRTTPALLRIMKNHFVPQSITLYYKVLPRTNCTILLCTTTYYALLSSTKHYSYNYGGHNRRNVQYSARSNLWDAKPNVTTTFRFDSCNT